VLLDHETPLFILQGEEAAAPKPLNPKLPMPNP
jgi:hypothetical protein